MTTDKVFSKHLLPIGRMMSGSKSGYRQKYPNNLAIFNANIITENEGKAWFGDIDVDLDNSKLFEVAKELNEDLYILREMDARFENEDLPIKDLMKKAVCIIKTTGEILKK